MLVFLIDNLFQLPYSIRGRLAFPCIGDMSESWLDDGQIIEAFQILVANHLIFAERSKRIQIAGDLRDLLPPFSFSPDHQIVSCREIEHIWKPLLEIGSLSPGGLNHCRYNI